MNDVTTWLQALGLGKYAKAFEDNGIEFAALPSLTGDMLERLGLPIGPRAKLRAAISKLATSGRKNSREDETTRRTATGEAAAERRQITAMFCDLVGSSKLAGRLDPEDLGLLLQAYQGACGAVIDRYQGHVSQYRGDGIEVIFGWPATHEDAAERAVRAGLELIRAVKTVASPEPLSLRVGISTGIVVTGLGDPSSPSGAVGETLFMAARLQALAVPDSVVISEATSRLVSERFDQEDLGVQNLRGILIPVHAFRVLQVRESRTRFQAAHSRAITPLVGRRTELAFLQQRWRDANDREGQAVFVSGAPGIGKSRIVHELVEWIKGEPRFGLSLQCLPHCTQSALYPVIRQIERLAGFAPEDSDEAKLDKIERLLSVATEQVGNTAPFVAEMLSIPTASRYAPIALTGQLKKARTLSVLVDLLLALSMKKPLLCVLEDAQWIDPSTQELLELAVGRIENARALIIVTHRPEYRWHSSTHGYVSGLSLGRLGRRGAAEMARLALRDHAVSDAVLEKIIDESDAIPLFIEELARSAVESSSLKEHDSPPGVPAPGLVPEALRDSLVARLDRVPQARSVAQMAAAIGREFSFDMLLRVSALAESELESSLMELEKSEIVQLIDIKPLGRYVFKHALLRDAAYESLLKTARCEIHARVAATLEKEWPDIITNQPELLAYHYSLAAETDCAARYWLLGGQRAHSRSANLEAIGQFQKVLELLKMLPETPERVSTKLQAHLSLGLCFIAVDGYSADNTRESFERARSLSVELGEPNKEMQAIFGLWGHHWMRARHDRAVELARSLLDKAEQVRDPIVEIVGHRSLGSTLFTLGELLLAREHLERAIALGQLATFERSSFSYAVDPRIAARLMLAWDLWLLGYPEQAHDNVLNALRQATGQADPYSIAFAHYVTSVVQLLRGELQDSLLHAERSLALSREYRIGLYALYARFGRGCALARMGQTEHAFSEIREAIEEADRSNLGYMRGFMLGWLATVQAETGDPGAALSTIDEALEQINDVAGRAWEAELQRLRGDTLLLASPRAPNEAERSYNSAIATARKQRARSLELRATTSLARLLQDQHRGEEARQHLAPIVSWFTEGLDTADLREARALLGQLIGDVDLLPGS